MTRRPSVVRSLFLAMMGTGLCMGLVFPLVVSPFAEYRPGLRLAFSGLCVVAGLVVGALNFFLVRRFLLRRVDLVSRQIESLARGEGISATRLSLDSEDVLGRLVEQFNGLIDRLSGTLRRVIETVEGFTAHADETGQTARQLVSSVDKKSEVIGGTALLFSGMRQELETIEKVLGRLQTLAAESRAATNAQVQQVASINEQIARLQNGSNASAGAMDRASIAIQRTSSATGELTRALEGAAASTTEMDATVRELNRTLKESAALSESVTTAAEAGGRSVASTRAGMERIRESVAAAAGAIAELNKQVGEIGAITDVIDDVTEQTGLLALNAAILAAQAGENGRGFAVVADQIRSLATRTAHSTREITAIVNALRMHADASLASMGQSRALVEEGVSLSGQASTLLGSIQESAVSSLRHVQASSRSIGEIAATAHSLSETVDSIAARAREIATATSEQDKEIAALQGMVQSDFRATTAIAAATREQELSVRGIEKQAGELSGLAGSSEEALHSGRGQTDMLAAAIETLQALDAKERDQLNRSAADAQYLTEQAHALRQEIERLKPREGGA